ncbi:DUF4440 domain-containing protein [Kitasatospora sp. NPDC048365]|uniref:DUF4440 domain-containing protein n=1 Tax=Kitasatospora sp. NPDC048365 TaxID=3364050 RepID=UPI0037157A79
MSGPDTTADTTAEITALTGAFFAAFDSREGRVPPLEMLRELFVPGGLLVVTAPAYACWGVEEFVESRRAVLLPGGRVTEFAEWETGGRTELFGGIASRFAEYAKSGRLDGDPFTGGGAIAFQYVRTPEGWRITSAVWHDHA